MKRDIESQLKLAWFLVGFFGTLTILIHSCKVPWI